MFESREPKGLVQKENSESDFHLCRTCLSRKVDQRNGLMLKINQKYS